MNLNKLLCKYCDDDDKGHVTIGDVLLNLLVTGLIIIAIPLYIIGAISMYKMLYVCPPGPIPTIYLYGYTYFIAASTVVAIAITEWLLGVRVATCRIKR